MVAFFYFVTPNPDTDENKKAEKPLSLCFSALIFGAPN